MVRFGRIAPGFFVRDIQEAIDFWTGKLGFELTFTNGDPLCFAIVRRDDAELHLGLRPEAAGQGHCHIIVEGIDELYRACATGGVTIKQAPKVQSWGLRDMIVADPDGNTVEIGEPVAQSVSA